MAFTHRVMRLDKALTGVLPNEYKIVERDIITPPPTQMDIDRQFPPTNDTILLELGQGGRTEAQSITEIRAILPLILVILP